MRELMVQLALVLLGGTSTPPYPYEGATTAIVEIGPGRALPAPAPVTDIMKELTLHIVGQFFVTMRYCIELILFGRSSFKFVRSLLENKI